MEQQLSKPVIIDNLYKAGKDVYTISEAVQLTTSQVYHLMKQHKVGMHYNNQKVQEDYALDKYMTKEFIDDLYKLIKLERRKKCKVKYFRGYSFVPLDLTLFKMVIYLKGDYLYPDDLTKCKKIILRHEKAFKASSLSIEEYLASIVNNIERSAFRMYCVYNGIYDYKPTFDIATIKQDIISGLDVDSVADKYTVDKRYIRILSDALKYEEETEKYKSIYGLNDVTMEMWDLKLAGISLSNIAKQYNCTIDDTRDRLCTFVRQLKITGKCRYIYPFLLTNGNSLKEYYFSLLSEVVKADRTKRLYLLNRYEEVVDKYSLDVTTDSYRIITYLKRMLVYAKDESSYCKIPMLVTKVAKYARKGSSILDKHFVATLLNEVLQPIKEYNEVNFDDEVRKFIETHK